VKLLFDQNLSRLLVEHLRDVFPESVHVAELGFESETDFGIWQYAKAHDYIVVSKDSDFRQLAFLYGPPPKVLWLRVGNASTSEVLHVILDNVEVIEHFAMSEEEALLALQPA
jgi:predicted nuclease of predicted toxin-antitoxin system